MQQRLISAEHPDGNGFILSGLVKKTYRIGENGLCTAMPDTSEWVEELAYYPDNEELLAEDFEIYAYKRATDIVIKAAAIGGGTMTQLLAEIKTTGINHAISVYGDRTASYVGGRLTFSAARSFEEIPLRYDYAYGGNDQVASEKHMQYLDPKIKEGFPQDINWDDGSPFIYPRNPFGKGYLVENVPSTLGEVSLPNLEDPANLLQPRNIFAGSVGHWHRMPLPKVTDWLDHLSFPRLNYFGYQHFFQGDTSRVTEIAKGWAPESVFCATSKKPNHQLASRFSNGASMGLQLNEFRPGQAIQLNNLHRKKRSFTLTLPKEFPEIQVDGRNGRMLKTEARPYTIKIDTYSNELTMIWGGTAFALRPYHEEELTSMPMIVKWRSL